jgi:hypothetical protein
MVRLRKILARGTVAVAALFILMTGCGLLRTVNANREKYEKINDMTPLPPSQDTFLVEAADRFALMALFAEVVYRRDGSDCGYLQGEAKGLWHGMPRQADGKAGWKRWIPDPPLKDKNTFPCFDESGLYYETYIFEESGGKVTEAVIAFRGTENRKGQYVYDWGTNLAAAFGFEPKQYALASQHIPRVIKALRGRFGKEPRIFATGHSLGGGLAQQAGYLSREIEEVFTFNTTPVTNWSHLRMNGLIGNGFPIIHRVYNGGEFLEKARFVSTSFTRARFGRHDIGLQFEDRSNFKGHGMQIIACHLANLIRLRESALDADHHYPVQYIRDQVLWETVLTPAKPICPPLRRKKVEGKALSPAPETPPPA